MLTTNPSNLLQLFLALNTVPMPLTEQSYFHQRYFVSSAAAGGGLLNGLRLEAKLNILQTCLVLASSRHTFCKEAMRTI